MNQKPSRHVVFEWYLVVMGSGEFPFDMLRYDACFPFEQTDASKMELHRREKRVLVLCRRGKNAQAAEVDRWTSFGWKVMGAYADSFDARELAGLLSGGSGKEVTTP